MSGILKYRSQTFKLRRLSTVVVMSILALSSGFPLFAQQQRFPKPEFESGYTQPVTSMPEARSDFFAFFDVFVLILALSLVSWLILKKRSRRGVLAMSVFSILYFGFFREGCICSVGSLQNVTLALFQPEYSIPLSALAFFVIPLVYTLFFGRTFCAGVCPLGAIQDVLLLRPVTMKTWLQKVLGLLPYIYLGLSVLYAATATDFIICRYDPFVGIYRLDATFFMFVIGAIFLLLSVFVARPYCRFFCPYAVLLNWMSRFSKHHLTITPNKCIQCRLCDDSCPLGAINKPVPVKAMEDRSSATKRFIRLSLIIPVLVLLGGWTLSNFHESLANVNGKVRLANELMQFDPDVMLASVEIEAFKSAGTPVEDLYTEAAVIVGQFYWGAWILGGFLGLVFGLTLSGLSVFKYREDYSPDKGECVSCARCLKYCPVEK